jgi:hypothetical protein
LVVSRFDAGAAESSLLDAHVGESFRLGESQRIVFAAEIFFPLRSLAVCRLLRLRAAKYSRINRIEVHKIKRVCAHGARLSGPRRHQTTPFLKWPLRPFPSPWRAARFLRATRMLERNRQRTATAVRPGLSVGVSALAPMGSRVRSIFSDAGEHDRIAVGKFSYQRQAAAHGLNGLPQR